MGKRETSIIIQQKAPEPIASDLPPLPRLVIHILLPFILVFTWFTFDRYSLIEGAAIDVDLIAQQCEILADLNTITTGRHPDTRIEIRDIAKEVHKQLVKKQFSDSTAGQSSDLQSVQSIAFDYLLRETQKRPVPVLKKLRLWLKSLVTSTEEKQVTVISVPVTGR